MSFGPGQIFAGKYRIERLLGAGGMGEVYAATHLELGELVALKVMRDEDTSSTDALARFQREARAAARLKSEFIARVLDVGRREGGLPFIVLEHIEGQDLQEVCRRGPVPVAEAAGFIAQACEGVAEAHALGMVHRDLKLRNLFLTKRPDGRPLVKILDFGVVKLSSPKGADSDQPSLTLTQAETIIGSLPYTAPEQIQMSSKVDARADVWSLGVCLYELLAGTRPFPGQTVAEIVTSITRRPLVPLRSLRPEIPDALADAVERALEKNLHRRFQSVAELAGALSPFVGDRTLGDRVQAVLLQGVKPVLPVIPVSSASDPVAATRDWGASNGVPLPATVDDEFDATTRALPPRPADVAAQAHPPPSFSVAAVVPTKKSSLPFFVAVAVVGTVIALAALVGWSTVRGRTKSAGTSASAKSIDPPELTAVASTSAPSAELPSASAAASLPTESPSTHTRVAPPPVKPRPRGTSSAAAPAASGAYDKF